MHCEIYDPLLGRKLSKREQQIVKMLAKGLASKEVACALELSVKTVEVHRANIARKTGTDCVVKLLWWAVRNRVIDPLEEAYGEYIPVS